MKIGNIELKYGLALAPMAGVTDRAYRRICKEFGAEYAVSEMISAKAVHFRDVKTAQLAKFDEIERPMALQLFGSEPDIISEAVKIMLDSENPPDAIDINMGCPVRKIVSNGEGSALMKDAAKAYAVANAAVKASSVPVTAKIRTGIDSESINAVEIALALEDAGISVVCVHGRTREQMYAPPVDLDTIADVKSKCSIPVFGNGDIYTADDAVNMLSYTGCDGVMLARGTMGNPWLFREISARIERKEFTPPTYADRILTAEKHIRLLVSDKGEYTGIREARKHFSYYIKGFTGAAAYRDRINKAVNSEEFYGMINELKALYGVEKSDN